METTRPWTAARLRHLDTLLDQLTEQEAVLLWIVTQLPADVRQYMARTLQPVVDLYVQQGLADEDVPIAREARAWLTLVGTTKAGSGS